MSDNDQKTVSRRRFLSVLGTTGAGAAVLSGCSTEKVEKLIPYLVQSEDQVPGVATWYASTCTECSAGCGLHVRTREGRAVKLEGNPQHPVNAGRLCAMGQAGLQGLYNPGRIKGPMQRSGDTWRQVSWDDAIALLGQQLGAAGAGLAVLSGAPRGSLTGFLADVTATVGGRLVRWEPFDQTALRLASKRVFGRDEAPLHDFAKARYIVSFGADFLDTWGPTVEHQRQFAESHGFSREGGMAKHVYFAPRASLTGLNADEWHGIKPGSETLLALAMAGVLFGERGDAAPTGAPSVPVAQAAEATGLTAEAITRLAKEFAAAKPSLAVAGGIGSQHAGAIELCAAVHLLNQAAGNLGETVLFGGDLDCGDGHAAFAALQQAMEGGQVKVLLVHEANPVYGTPKAGKFAEALAKVPFKVSTSLFVDETSVQCDLILPGLHALERWDDANPRAGVWSLMQPVMEPVYPNRNPGDVLLAASRKAGGALAKFTATSWEAYLKDRWAAMARGKGRDAASFWRESLAKGGVFEPQAAAQVKAVTGTVATAAPAIEGTGEFTLVPYASSLLYDGRGTNKPWLLETPDPVTKITWHTWVELHPDAAKRLDVREGEILKVTSAHGSIEAPAYIYPGLRPDVVAIPMGFGHTEYGEYAKHRGVNYLDLLGPATGDFVPYLGTRVTVERLREYRKVAKTEGNPRQLGRGIAEAMPVAYAAKGLTIEEAAKAGGHPAHEINTESEVEALKGWRKGEVGREEGEGRRLGNYRGEHPKWGMTIDLAKCTGCSACSTACYAENNIPWVGEDQVLRGRELSWIRIERYWEGGTDGEPIEARFVPMPCQHCDNAPCEPVCPVYAAYHTPDGLNGQVYNRCVGTRYCANNCPYKVRYFNWHAYARKAFVAPFELQLNPDVVVRARGVMEKCTFCVQRIRGAQHTARVTDSIIKDGELTTACAQACPSGAIVFGDLNDPQSRVRRIAEDPRGYHILEDINVRPAITYLAKVVHREPAHAATGGGEQH
jgi:anaerobic selenocysteine-containing dehydrogenase/Fe-S-cluster-containing dehydrogenase component